LSVETDIAGQERELINLKGVQSLDGSLMPNYDTQITKSVTLAKNQVSLITFTFTLNSKVSPAILREQFMANSDGFSGLTALQSQINGYFISRGQVSFSNNVLTVIYNVNAIGNSSGIIVGACQITLSLLTKFGATAS